MTQSTVELTSDIPSLNSTRAKARWAILRHAILKDKKSLGKKFEEQDRIVNDYSIHKFPGFNLLKRILVDSHDDSVDAQPTDYELVEYEVPLSLGGKYDVNVKFVRIRTRERRVCSKVCIKELMSHIHYGVDNTGNTKVWDCSNVIAASIMGKTAGSRIEKIELEDNTNDSHLLVQKPLQFSSKTPFVGLENILSLAIPRMRDGGKVLKVAELGGGMAALPSLFLASLGCCALNEPNKALPFIDVTITDGHPSAVESNEACINNSKQLGTMNNVRCKTMLWKANAEGASECNSLRQESILRHGMSTSKSCPEIGFDLIVVSDCTHFTNFHADLGVTIGRLLRVGGLCLLCQPCRGISLNKFIDLVEALNREESDGPLFQVDLHKNYHPELSKQHKRIMQVDGGRSCGYNPNIHYPLLLIMKKMRAYKESEDTVAALQYVKNL